MKNKNCLLLAGEMITVKTGAKTVEACRIAQTAYTLSGDREKAIEAGCNDYISKPINKDALLRLVEKYFQKNENSN
jgi:CheY-like chemotaxis protein